MDVSHGRVLSVRLKEGEEIAATGSADCTIRYVQPLEIPPTPS